MSMPIKLKYLTLIVLFITAFGFTFFHKIDRIAQAKTANLTGIPIEIGEWHMISQQNDKGKFESTFLNDVLFRTYKRQDGRAIMLAIAYGADQKQHFSIHVPEGCYRAAGYDITSFGIAQMDMPDIVLKKMLVKGEWRTEPVQYWIVLNGKVVTNHFERKMKQVYYSLFGAKAGGVLVRVSSLSTDKDFQKDYEIQRSFISDLYKTLNPELRRLLFGDKA